jgi:hypothetical protein
MHISNERYFDDRQRHDLALRMIRHEARTCTIRMCTGLTDDRIRRLYQTYATHMRSMPVRRHRGKSPRQIAFFTRNPRAQFEASLLASMFTAFGVLDAARREAPSPLSYGELFCDAYETHLQLSGWSGMSFEHAWFLLHLLMRNTGLGTLRCRHCGGHFLHDRATVVKRSCPGCKLKAMARRPRRKRAAPARIPGGIAARQTVHAPPAAPRAARLGA